MNELLKFIKDGRLFSYTLDDGGTGIVIADTIEEAEQKVRDAYTKHGGYENGMDDVQVYVWELYEDSYFSDAPDVLEIHS